MTTEEEETVCPCKHKKCERHGNCAECLAHHARPGSKRPAWCKRANYSAGHKQRKV